MKCQPKANNNREEVVVCARHVVKRPCKRMRASIYYAYIFPLLEITDLFIFRRICTKWYFLLKTYMQYYVKCIQFASLEHYLTKNSFINIISNFQNIEPVDLPHCWKALDYESVSILAFCCPKLWYLDISNCRGIESRVI